MASSSASQVFEIPKYFFFSEKGIYSGSRSDRDFNYKVIPVKPKDETEPYIRACWWEGRNCMEKSENVTEKRFAFSEEGHRELIKWLEEECMSRPEVLEQYEKQHLIVEAMHEF